MARVGAVHSAARERWEGDNALRFRRRVRSVKMDSVVWLTVGVVGMDGKVCVDRGGRTARRRLRENSTMCVYAEIIVRL
jgi:hypothetical protein